MPGNANGGTLGPYLVGNPPDGDAHTRGDVETGVDHGGVLFRRRIGNVELRHGNLLDSAGLESRKCPGDAGRETLDQVGLRAWLLYLVSSLSSGSIAACFDFLCLPDMAAEEGQRQKQEKEEEEKKQERKNRRRRKEEEKRYRDGTYQYRQ